MLVGAKTCDLPQDESMTPTGFEPVSATTDSERSLRQAASLGAAKSGAILPENTRTDPRLARLVAIWPRLPESARQAIMEIVDGQKGQLEGTP